MPPLIEQMGGLGLAQVRHRHMICKAMLIVRKQSRKPTSSVTHLMFPVVRKPGRKAATHTKCNISK